MKKDKKFKIFNEIMNDAFWLSYILEIKRSITDYNQKEILSSFLIFYSSIFVEETIKANYGGLSGKRDITLDDIEKFRNYNLKYYPFTNSETVIKVMLEMGINFEPNIFDIILSLDNRNLLDINFRNWDLNNKEKFELYDGLVSTPSRWMEILMPDIYNAILEQIKKISKEIVDKISISKINKKSYSSYNLFKNNIGNSEKLYILQRYGLIKTTMFIDNLIRDNISFNIGELHFDFKTFITKTKAIIIEMIWNDKKVSKSNSVIDSIFEKNKKDIRNDFYSINRKCRNNLHYSDYHYLSKKEVTILNEYQNIYLNNVIETFNYYISLKFGIFYNIGLYLAKLEYWSRIDRSDKMNNYIIIHGSFGSKDGNWFPWLKEYIEQSGKEVFVPQMPVGVGNQNFENWSNILNQLDINENTVIIAHSIAPIFVCKYLITNQIKVKKLIFVCGFNNYSGIDSDFDAVNEPMFIDNFDDVKKYCKDIVCYYSDNDPYVKYDVEKAFADKLTDKQYVIKNGGHINAETGYTKFEEILKEI
ncbi:MAG TPA: hypothetical protein DHV70_03350 [Firmicutes bacterium]|nr:hypothetical protein [Bacillota bacterium]